MLRPNKFTDPHNCILYNSHIIIKILSSQGKITNKTLQTKYSRILGNDASSLYIPCLDFLYLLNLISYNIDEDNLELKK